MSSVGGKVINEIIDETGVSIDIEDDVRVTSANEESARKAEEWVKISRENSKSEKYFRAKSRKLWILAHLWKYIPERKDWCIFQSFLKKELIGWKMWLGSETLSP